MCGHARPAEGVGKPMHGASSPLNSNSNSTCNDKRNEPLRSQPSVRVRHLMSAAHGADVRPAGVSSGQYRQNSGLPLVHSQPTAVEREQAHAKILSASARTVPYPAPALSLHYIATPHLPLCLQASPLDSDPGRYHGSGWTGHVSKFGATASRKGLNCNPDPPDC